MSKGTVDASWLIRPVMAAGMAKGRHSAAPANVASGSNGTGHMLQIVTGVLCQLLITDAMICPMAQVRGQRRHALLVPVRGMLEWAKQNQEAIHAARAAYVPPQANPPK